MSFTRRFVRAITRAWMECGQPVSVSRCSTRIGEQIDGRADVMASWFEVMVVSEPPALVVSDECVIVTGQRAMVLCKERVDNTEVVTSNLFVLEDGSWKMTSHQATYLPGKAKKPPRRPDQ